MKPERYIVYYVAPRAIEQKKSACLECAKYFSNYTKVALAKKKHDVYETNRRRVHLVAALVFASVLAGANDLKCLIYCNVLYTLHLLPHAAALDTPQIYFSSSTKGDFILLFALMSVIIINVRTYSILLLFASPLTNGNQLRPFAAAGTYNAHDFGMYAGWGFIL